MVFANLVFLYLFLPLNLVLYYISKNVTYRNVVLVLFSMFFYAWGEPVWIILLIFSAGIDYLHGLLIEKYFRKFGSKLAVISCLTLNLGLLILFKYSGFMIDNVNVLFGLDIKNPGFILPIGISFYTFQTISYVIDVYRGKVKAQHSFMKFMLFVSLYHQLVAGPIVRYSQVADEIDNRRVTALDMSEGITRLMIGLAKKVVIANTAGQFVGRYMDGDLATLSISGAWFGAFMFMIQLYFDFSGYSDMAIGLGRMFGFHYVENFNYPYIAKSATEFWRRWHISLGSFFRDYLYIPLGGNRAHPYRNLLITWFMTGLWHGANWNFIIWGVYYGVLILMEKLFLGKILDKLPGFVRHLYLIFLTIIGWVVFYFTDMKRLVSYLGVMFGAGSNPLTDIQLSIELTNNIFWIILAIIFCTPVVAKVKSFVANRLTGGKISCVLVLQVIMNIGLLAVSTALLVGESYNPFLYFRF